MTLPVPNQNYSVTNGSNSSAVFITQLAQRNPTSNDLNYQVTKRWVNTLTGKEFILTGFTSTGGVTQAVWVNLTNGTASALDELTGNSGGAIGPDGGGNINVLGDSTSIRIDGTTNTLTAAVVLPVSVDVVLIGDGTSISSVANSTEGKVLTCHTSGPPTFETGNANFTWSPKTTNFAAVAGNGYFISGVNIVGSTPSSAYNGDVVKFICNTATFQLTSNVAIRIGSQSSSTTNNTAIGDTLSLVYDGVGTWWAQDAPIGVWEF